MGVFYNDFCNHFQNFSHVRRIPTKAFFFGMEPDEEMQVAISSGKRIIISF